AIRPQPVASDDGTAPAWQRQLPLSLSFDHRIVDGAPAARFLAAVAAALADPHDQAPLIR
ncbi:MAG: 2-oxo acid dehydrogenase subunit E2, partial [Planctomycetota bacterium]